ncbi:ankyrin repeat-containing domain protein [Scenedesmus sp. NREL 46B-D3]|nr:ankyrin repeat-containing domain protein [Scenedesmus sp. NREL 46B-D3]
MAVSDDPHASDNDSDGEGLNEEQYEWLQEQLAHIGNLRIEADEEEDEWVDPSGGVLVNIFAACEGGSMEQLGVNIQELRDTQYTVDTPGPDGDTALHLACLYGHQQCVELLLREGATADPVNPEDGTTPLHDAAAGGYAGIVQMLLERAGPGNVGLQDSDGDTPLHNAARGGHLAVVQQLLAAGAAPSVINSSGKTPAGESDDQEVVRALVAAAAAALHVGGAAAAAPAAAGAADPTSAAAGGTALDAQ